MSTKRSFVSTHRPAESAPASRISKQGIALYALVAGVLMMIAGSFATIGMLMVPGFFLATGAGFVLNALFWAEHHEKTGDPRFFSIRSYPRD
jgi:hypothetical protein